MESYKYLDIAISAIKDKVEKDTKERFCKSFNKLLETEARMRREKVKAQILEMAQLRIALDKFEITYNLIKNECGNIESVDRYLANLRKQITLISNNKNKPLLFK